MTSKVNDAFWSHRIRTFQSVTIPSMHRQLLETGRWDSLDLQYTPSNGVPKPHYFWDSDLAKFIESLCYGLKYCDTPSVYVHYTELIEEFIVKLAASQHRNGYLNTYFTVVEPNNKFQNITWCHELYCAGHLLEAAVAHYETTQQTRLLDVVTKYIDLICVKFGPNEGQLHGYPGHQVLEMALARLYHHRPEPKYLQLLQFFIHERGAHDTRFFDTEALKNRDTNPYHYVSPAWPAPRSYWYMQADKPFLSLTEVQGHSVRVVYYLCGAQALANLTHDQAVHDKVMQLWMEMCQCKMYIHGGIGSVAQWEGFGSAYELPWDAYAETCASVGLVFLARLILESGLRRDVAQVMERALYNNVLGGLSLDGTAFYYEQPITGSKGLKRQAWFECSCCPPNVTRLLNSLERYIYTLKPHLIAVNLYIGSEFHAPGVDVKLNTSYPLRGSLQIEITTTRPLILAVRAPDTSIQQAPAFTADHEYTIGDEGYIYFDADVWDSSTITIDFSTEVKIIKPDPRVEANKGKLAVERGPFVYAVEKDSGYLGDLDEVAIGKDTEFVEVVEKWEGLEYVSLITTTSNDKVIKFVPYFVTGNTVPGQDFRIWVDEI